MLAVLGTLLVAVLLAFQAYRRAAAVMEPVVRDIAVFDSYARLTLWTSPERAEPVFQECTAELAALHRTLNRFDPASELARLNAAAAQEAFACSPLLWDVLQAARQGYAQTEGAFDISVGPLMAVWGFHRKRDTLPTEADLQAAMARVGLPRVQFDDAARTVRFAVDGMSLDCGGIAKGYALDRVMAIDAPPHRACADRPRRQCRLHGPAAARTTALRHRRPQSLRYRDAARAPPGQGTLRRDEWQL
jgi:thiamine biosynthesis lipoprotein